ncbi:MAG: hypothetical protein OEX19_07740 [Gammaproteobacteria bacterium]|nr:hypothetical protein [Gammaproteobacteria bacterium]
MEEINNKLELLYKLAQDVSYHYVKSKYKHNFAGNGEDFIYRLRDSLQFRVNSVAWHYSNLELRHKQAVQHHFFVLKGDERIDHLMNHQTIQSFVFDDIIFNLLSAFEYLGNLVGYFWKDSHGKKMRWRGLAKSVRDKSNGFPYQSLSIAIDFSDRCFVEKLEDYRANIFHYQNHEGGVSTYIDMTLGEDPFRINTSSSDRFKKVFKEFNVNEDQNELLAYSKYCISVSFDIVEDILKSLLEWEVVARPFKI